MNKRTLKWLWKVSGRNKQYIGVLMFAQGIIAVTSVFEALLLRNIVDSAVAHEGDLFRYNLILIILLVLAQVGIQAVIRWLNELSRAAFENTFKDRLMRQLLHRDYAAVSAIHSGEWLNRLTSDTVVVTGGCVEILPGLTGMFVRLISALIMMVALDIRFASFIIPAGAVFVVLTYFFRKVLKRLHKNVQEQDGRLRVFLQERISSMMIIRSFAADDQTGCEAREKMGAHKTARMRKNRFSNLCNIGFTAAMNAMFLFGVGYCGYGILTGTVSYGTLTAIIQLVRQIQSPFANITGFLPKLYATLASAERLMEAEDFPEEDESRLEMPEIRKLYSRLTSIGLQNVCFTYFPPAENVDDISKDSMPVVLENISLELQKGEYTAFTGQSGCGKSTVLKLLMCIYHPDSGKRYYRAGDMEVPMTSAHRRLFAYVPQGNLLMSGTIREVVAFADPAGVRDDERLWQALEIACADRFVSDLEDGIDTLLGEHGTGLSEGQMQRLSIARAVFSGSPILLLDEATSALDTETERQLLKNLRELTDKTVVIVTHRPAVLSICDRVLSFSENGIKEGCTDPGRESGQSG